ncbi:MAG: hypothetical protein M5R40_01595 [Anaerolineae bacterium]|nr:hypothetical protein [Anaerolineae bacterium]
MQTFHEHALEGQHIVISGGLGALGLAVVKGLVDHGARMTINDLLEERDAYERLAAAGVRRDRVAYLKGDMTDEGRSPRSSPTPATGLARCTRRCATWGWCSPRP